MFGFPSVHDKPCEFFFPFVLGVSRPRCEDINLSHEGAAARIQRERAIARNVVTLTHARRAYSERIRL